MDTALFQHVGDAITKLTNDWEWESVGDSVADVVEACKESVESWYSDMLIGVVFAWIINPPSGWLLLDGSTYATADYPELSALLPAHLISEPDFTLPDVENSFPFGVQAEEYVAIKSGSNILNLSVEQLPSHSHLYVPPALTLPVGPPPNTLVSGIGTPTQTGTTGSGADIDKRPARFGLIYAVYAGRE